MELNPAGPLDVVETLGTERAMFVELLRTLEPDEWRRPTECPVYDVHGVAAHILGDDLSLLSRQRDDAPPGLLAELQSGGDFRTALDRFNDRWVASAQFFSPSVLIDLLVLTGQWTADWYGAVDPQSLGEPVGFFGATGPSPYWQIAAREYVERWVHHHQIRRALGRPDLDEASILQPAVATVVRGLRAHLRDLDTDSGASVVVTVEGAGSWTLVRASETWQLFDGRASEANAEVGLDRASATPALSRGLSSDDVRHALSLHGDLELAGRAANGVASLAGR
jgi:uncharacterized protein (TIGR03083 family)